jgi:hypothetical protein
VTETPDGGDAAVPAGGRPGPSGRSHQGTNRAAIGAVPARLTAALPALCRASGKRHRRASTHTRISSNGGDLLAAQAASAADPGRAGT